MVRPSLMIHGGAGAGSAELAQAQRPGCLAAVEAGWAVLARGGSALDAVCEAVVVLEDDPAFNAGTGSVLTCEGRVEMDAAVMDGNDLRAGAVALVRRVRNPVRLARAILEDGRHVFLAGVGAEDFAQGRGVLLCEPQDLITPSQQQRWQRRSQTAMGTVGAVAVDRAGRTAAATSTGGMDGKLDGRIGDSAVIGGGTFADDALGAVSATGVGEAILRVTLARSIAELLRDGSDPADAAGALVRLLPRAGGSGGVIVADPYGRVGYAHNTAHMTVAWRRADMDAPQVVV